MVPQRETPTALDCDCALCCFAKNLDWASSIWRSSRDRSYSPRTGQYATVSRPCRHGRLRTQDHGHAHCSTVSVRSYILCVNWDGRHVPVGFFRLPCSISRNGPGPKTRQQVRRTVRAWSEKTTVYAVRLFPRYDTDFQEKVHVTTQHTRRLSSVCVNQRETAGVGVRSAHSRSPVLYMWMSLKSTQDVLR